MTQLDFAEINLLPTKNGLDFGVHPRYSILVMTAAYMFLRSQASTDFHSALIRQAARS
jgi:hypothetical protein